MVDYVQTSISANAAAGAPGQVYDLGGPRPDIVSKRAQEPIAFGSYVSFIGEDCELSDTTGEVTGRQGGIALIDQSKPSGAGYVAGDMVRVMRKGRVWVATEQQVTAQASAFTRFAGTGAQGAWRADADTANAVAAPTTNYFLVIDAATAVVEINQP